MNEEAKSFAKQQEELIRKQLGDMYSNLTSSKDASITEAELRKQNLLSKIEQSRQPIENQFQTDTRGAYANKMLSQQSVSDLLNRMNLSNSGFGMGQRIGVDTAYGKDVAGLMSSRTDAIQGLENQKLNTMGEHNATLAGIDSTYAGAKLDMDKYIGERATQAYDKAYANYVNEQQTKWERDFQQNQANISNSQEWARINNSKQGDIIKDLQQKLQNSEYSQRTLPSFVNDTRITTNITKMVPNLNKTGQKWFYDNIVDPQQRGTNINLYDFGLRLEAALAKGIITDKEEKAIIKAYGLD